MLIKSFIRFISFHLVLLSGNMVSAQGTNFPVPAGNPNQLFYLQRSPNIHTIICELNYKGNTIDSNNPVHVYWIRYADKGQKEELTGVQKMFAYGIESKEVSVNNYELNFTSYNKFKMYLKPGEDKKFHVYVTLNKKQVILEKIYIEIKGGTFWKPNIEWVEISGLDPATHTIEKERFKI